MEQSCQTISVITPFYKGNRYINELVSNVNAVAQAVKDKTGMQMELIVVNDSPDVPVELTVASEIPVTVLNNPQNLGIHGARINGIRQAKGQWIQMLDQDDLLIPEGYLETVARCQGADVVVGNCYYYHGENKTLLYAGKKVMDYLITENRFLTIRNLIASPGHCLIRKAALPAYWLDNPMTVNGADDYFLWMLMFSEKAVFVNNPAPVYIHRNSQEGNLSFDLEKMYRSCEQMCRLLENAPEYPHNKRNALARSVYFKYLHDTRKLNLAGYVQYFDKVVQNGIYKATTLFLS